MSIQATIQPNFHQNKLTWLNQNTHLTNPIQVSALTLGGEMEVGELASLQTPTLLDGIELSTALDIDPDGFERIYQWFLS